MEPKIAANEDWREKISRQLVYMLADYVLVKHYKPLYKLTEEEAHNFRLIETLKISLDRTNVGDLEFDVTRQFHCLNCDHRFEVPNRHDTSDHKGASHWDACPNCNSDNYEKQEAELISKD